MAGQARGEATRQKIIEAAADLFDDIGYGETRLAEIAAGAGVSMGAFYHHFDSKEALAVALLEETDRRMWQAVAAELDPGASPLENLVRSSFAVQRLVAGDKTVHAGRMLLQAQKQITPQGHDMNVSMSERFIAMATPVAEMFGPRTGVQAGEIAEVLWLSVMGHYAIWETLRDDPYPRIARTWRVLLHAIVPPEQVADHQDMVDRVARRYADCPAGIRGHGRAASSS